MHTPYPPKPSPSLFLLKIALKSPLGFGGVVEKQYLCSVKRNRPTPNPSAATGGRGLREVGMNPMTERSKHHRPTNYSSSGEEL